MVGCPKQFLSSTELLATEDSLLKQARHSPCRACCRVAAAVVSLADHQGFAAGSNELDARE